MILITNRKLCSILVVALLSEVFVIEVQARQKIDTGPFWFFVDLVLKLKKAEDDLSPGAKEVLTSIRKGTRAALQELQNIANWAEGTYKKIEEEGQTLAIVTGVYISSLVEKTITDKQVLTWIWDTAVDGVCIKVKHIITAVASVPGGIVMGVTCELIRQINELGMDAVAEKIKKGDIPFITKVAIEGACSSLKGPGKFVKSTAKGACKILAIAFDEILEKISDAMVNNDYRTVFDLQSYKRVLQQIQG